MLVLSRELGEEIVIGNDVRITVTHVGEGRVKIGVDAPKRVSVHRAELAEKIQAAFSMELTTG
jgi:carbon storage regulator